MEDIDDPGVSDPTAGMYFTLDFGGMTFIRNLNISSSGLFRYYGFKPPKTRENVPFSQDLSAPLRTSQCGKHEAPFKMTAFC